MAQITRVQVTPINDHPSMSGWGNVFVQGFSKIKVKIEYTPATMPNGRCVAYLNGSILLFDRSLQGMTSPVEFTTDSPVSINGVCSVRVYIYDMGVFTSSSGENIEVLTYSKPSVQLAEAIRFSSNPSVFDDSGTNISASAVLGIQSLGGRNSGTLSVRYKQSGASSYSDPVVLTSGATPVKINGSTALSLDKSYIVQFMATDVLTSEPTTIEIVVATKSVVLHSGDGGTGLGIGGYNNKPGLQVYWDASMYGDIKMEGQNTKFVLPASMYGSILPTTGVVGQLFFKLET